MNLAARWVIIRREVVYPKTSVGMRIAHLSDFHLLEPDVGRRGLRERVRLGYLSLFRPLDAEGRVRRALGALARACEKGFDHLVISGDLTEDGTAQQFEEVARVLFESRI